MRRKLWNRPKQAGFNCHGEGVRTYSDEGLVGLSWAFLGAGAHGVIAALWEVNDNSTPQLMDHLYSEISQGAPP
jgi:CHAT domain-containing protein